MRRFVINTLWLLVLIAVSGLIYIRVMPVTPEVYHKMAYPKPGGDLPAIGAYEAVRALDTLPPDALARLNAVIVPTARTHHLAGTAAGGHVSYVTRSRVFGFPDVTNAWVSDGALHIEGRQVFGRSDLGVNEARITGWLQALEQMR